MQVYSPDTDHSAFHWSCRPTYDFALFSRLLDHDCCARLQGSFLPYIWVWHTAFTHWTHIRELPPADEYQYNVHCVTLSWNSWLFLSSGTLVPIRKSFEIVWVNACTEKNIACRKCYSLPDLNPWHLRKTLLACLRIFSQIRKDMCTLKLGTGLENNTVAQSSGIQLTFRPSLF